MIRYAALLRGTESAWQAISYGITSVTVFAEVGAIYWNFALWFLAIWPAWLVLREFGEKKTFEDEIDAKSGVPVHSTIISSQKGEVDSK